MTETPGAGDGAADPAPPPAFPWPPHAQAGFVGSVEALADTWRLSLFRPTAFYRALPPEGGLGAALLYFLLFGVAGAGFDLFWTGVLIALLGPELPPLLELFGYVGNMGEALVGFLLSPLPLLVGLLGAALVTHALLVLVRGRGAPVAATVRTLAYTAGPQLLLIVPVLGRFVATGWIAILSIIGLREVHRTQTWRVVLALIVLPLLFALLLLALLALVLGIGLRSLG